MKKRTRIFVVTVSTVLVFVALAIAALPAIVALNRVKNEIAETLSQTTGRPVTIHKLSLSLYPWLGVRLDGATLGTTPGFGSTPLAKVDDALVEVRLLPLFSRRIVLRRVILTGLRLHLRENEAGQTNWATLTHASRPTTPSSRREAHEAPAFALLRAAGLTIKNAAIHYRNAVTGSHDILSHFDLQSGIIIPGHPVAMAMSGVLKTTPHSAFPFRVKTRVAYHGKTVVLHPLTLSVAALHVFGRVTASLPPSGLLAHGQLTVPTFAPRPLLAALGLHYTPRNPAVLKTASAHLAFSINPARVHISGLHLALDKTVITGTVTRLSHPLLYRAHLAVNAIRPLSYLPHSKATPKASGGLVVSGVSHPAPLSALPPFVGTISFGSLSAHGLSATQIHAHVDTRGGVLRLRPLAMDLYGGTFLGSMTSPLGKYPQPWHITAQLHNVHAGAVLRALHVFQELSGPLSARANLTGTGTTLASAEPTLSGSLSGSMPKGALRGMDLDFIAKDPRAAAGVHRARKIAGTAFAHLHASATVHQGVLHMQHLTMQTSRAVVHGQGVVTLATKTVNYLLDVTLKGGLTVPVRVQGPMGHIHFSVSLNKLFSDSSHNGVGSALRTLGSSLKHMLGFP